MNTEWILKCLEWLKKIEKKDYQWSLSGYSNAKLSAVGLFCKLSTIFENHYEFNKKKQKNILERYKKQDGFLYDSNERDNIIAETRQALSGLVNLGFDNQKVNINKYYKNKNNLYFMNDNLWNNPWGAGAQLSHYLFFLKLENNTERINNILVKVKKYQKNDGWYYKRPKDKVRINGIMKVFTGFDIINHKYDINMLHNICDSILNTNPSSGGCSIYDYVYVLEKCMESNYKIDICKDKLLKIYDLILTYQQTDGGFSYKKNKSQTNMYGKKITDGRKQGDLHGTTLMCMALCRIDKACNLGLKLNIPIT